MEFKEVQQFRQIWVWVLLGGILVLLSYGTFQQLILGKPWGSKPMPNLVLILVFLIVIGIAIFIAFIQLKTVIHRQGIKVNFSPLSKKEITWEEIAVVKYKPLREYGGWGVRYSFKEGKAFTTSGNQGIKIATKSGDKILIGTQKPEEAQKIISSIFFKNGE